jgi:hypothetical protein
MKIEKAGALAAKTVALAQTDAVSQSLLLRSIPPSSSGAILSSQPCTALNERTRLAFVPPLTSVIYVRPLRSPLETQQLP